MTMSSVSIADLVRRRDVTVSDGYRTRRGEHGQPGFRILRVADVFDNEVKLDGQDFVSERYKKQIGAKLAREGDILLTTKGTVGRVAIMPNVSEPVVYSPQLCFFRIADESRISRRYLRYWFSSPAFLRQAADRMNNTDMAAYINLADIRSLRLVLPEISEQLAIAAVLGALDDKIAINSRVIESCDKLSRTSFVSMLVDPEIRPLSEVARFVNGKAFTKNATGTGKVVIRIAELNSGIGGSTVYNDIDVDDDHIARPGDLLFAWSGSLTLHRWFRPEGIVNQHIFKVLPSDGYPSWLVHGLLARKLTEFKGIAADKATTMGHIQRRHLDELVEVPSAVQVDRHDNLMAGLWHRALAAEQESLSLGFMRDQLLPLLMSGRVRVKDAEREVEEVV